MELPDPQQPIVASSIVPTGINGQMTTKTGVILPQEEPNLAGARPKPVFFWTTAEVMKWLKRCCEQYYELYGHVFLEHDISGRALIRLNHNALERMGIEDSAHRDEIVRIILKLRLKTDIIEIKDLERKVQHS